MILPENFFPMLWFCVAVAFIIIELMTFAIVTVWFAIAALVLVFLSFLPIPLVWQLLIFLLISIGILLLFRPILLKKLKPKEKTNVDSLIGTTVLIEKSITKFDKGEIILHGIPWAVRSDDGNEIKKGSECQIIKIEGSTAIVKRLS